MFSGKSKPEFSGYRDLCYNIWHRRTLSREHYMIDIDCVEWRSPKGIVAIIERTFFNPSGPFTKDDILAFKKFQLVVTTELANARKVPAYLVLYEKDSSMDESPWIYCDRNCSICSYAPRKFHVYKIADGQASFWKEMSTTEYATFLHNLT